VGSTNRNSMLALVKHCAASQVDTAAESIFGIEWSRTTRACAAIPHKQTTNPRCCGETKESNVFAARLHRLHARYQICVLPPRAVHFVPGTAALP